jgi:pilus assembly protein CpaF
MTNRASQNQPKSDWRNEAGPLKPLITDPSITEIMVNRFDKIFVEREGVIQEVEIKFENIEQLNRMVQAIAVATSKEVNRRHPCLDARLPDGSRINIVTPPITLDGPAITIRKFTAGGLAYADLLSSQSLDDKIVYFLKQAVRARQNIIVSGGTGCGKTTLLNVICSLLSANERIVTIEDTAELKINAKNIVRMESRLPLGNEPPIELKDLVKNALRMRPDRLIVGECRGPEAWDMLQAMNTGHDGSLTTLHANSATDALRRLESMILRAGLEMPHHVIKDDISKTINLIIQMERFIDGKRRIVEIIEVVGLDSNGYDLRKIFTYNEHDGFKSSGQTPRFWETNKNPRVKFPNGFFNPENNFKIAV